MMETSKMKYGLGFLAFVLLAFLVSASFEGIPRCNPSEECIIGDFVFNDTWEPYNLQICTINITNSSGTLVVIDGAMDNRSDGWHNYTISFAPTGRYQALMSCFSGADMARISKDFVVEATSEGSEYSVIMSDFDEVTQTNDYRTRITVLDYLGRPVDATTVVVSLWQPNGTLVVDEGATVKESTGLYVYNYTTTSSSESGAWIAVAKVTVNGNVVYADDYFEIESSPAEVRILQITDTTPPTVTAQFRITNEGSEGYEYQYYWWVSPTANSSYGAEGNIDEGAGAKYIYSSLECSRPPYIDCPSWTSTQDAEVPENGVYYFEMQVFYGTESSFASERWSTPNPGGPGGVVTTTIPATTSTSTTTTTTTTIEDEVPGVAFLGITGMFAGLRGGGGLFIALGSVVVVFLMILLVKKKREE